ncbi:DUF2630 family protein [Paenarthrobacter sp. PH39-S1]|uniref:DUF2630 family protein n=1 Tax=Paenarthrobacter sp. PH39-S1 TaxID=3046204 RepID=UPI0024BB290F|nr:DUF2630 family protein [Paenarthrobacter sp. PH39-S1]MDJ0354536.1 DUF2630 family protein [Paenarthrobacter sp. PH39-S1]
MDGQQIHQRIQELVQQEQGLRDVARSEGESKSRSEELRRLEVQLDQCWDLLRQRRAKLDAGQNPDEAAVRPADEVEGYRQ